MEEKFEEIISKYLDRGLSTGQDVDELEKIVASYYKYVVTQSIKSDRNTKF